MKHPHADNMKLYAEDAMETIYPWLRWEFRLPEIHDWKDCLIHPRWDEGIEFRRKIEK